MRGELVNDPLSLRFQSWLAQHRQTGMSGRPVAITSSNGRGITRRPANQ